MREETKKTLQEFKKQNKYLNLIFLEKLITVGKVFLNGMT
jgi:hypothetical protein